MSSSTSYSVHSMRGNDQFLRWKLYSNVENLSCLHLISNPLIFQSRVKAEEVNIQTYINSYFEYLYYVKLCKKCGGGLRYPGFNAYATNNMQYQDRFNILHFCDIEHNTNLNLEYLSGLNGTCI